MRYLALLFLALALAGPADAQAPGYRFAFADNATFGSSSTGCTKTTTAGGGMVVIRCTPGADAFFLIPIISPPASEWYYQTNPTWDWRIHWQKTDTAATTCKVSVSFGVETDYLGKLPSWIVDADLDQGLVTHSKATGNVRYISIPDNTWITAYAPLDIGTGADCATASACAERLTLVKVFVDATSTSSGCEIRAVEIRTAQG